MKDCDGRTIHKGDTVEVASMSSYSEESNVKLLDRGTVTNVVSMQAGLVEAVNPSWRNCTHEGTNVPFTSEEIRIVARRERKRTKPAPTLHICPIALYGKCRNGECPHRVEHEQITSRGESDKFLCQNVEDHPEVDCKFRHTALFHCVPIVGSMAASDEHESVTRPNNGVRRITLKDRT